MEIDYDLKSGVCQHSPPEHKVRIIVPTFHKEKYGIRPAAGNYNLVFVLDGELELVDEYHTHWCFKKGDLFILPHSAETRNIIKTELKLLVLTFNNQIKKLCESFYLSNNAHENKERQPFTPLKLTDSMYHYVRLLEKYSTLNISCSFMYELKQKELFIIMAKTYTRAELIRFFSPIIHELPDFKTDILNHYQKGVSVQELVHKSNLNYHCFLKKFKLAFGLSAQKWILQQKAQQIKRLLSIPSTTLADIIREFGFSNGSHLNRYCHKYFGCTPSELTRMLKSDKAN